MKQLIGRKIGMTQLFAVNGAQQVVTVIEILPNIISQIKTVNNDGYNSYVIGYDKKRHFNKCEEGIAKKNKLDVAAFYREIICDDEKYQNLKIGDNLNASIFNPGDFIDVIGISKGKGYTGVIKCYHHKIGPKSHGSGYHRGLGSFANNGRCNNRVLPGKKMSGHRGFKQVTIFNLPILEINSEKNYILVKGAVPGNKKSLLKIRSTIKFHSNIKKPLIEFYNINK